MSQIYRIWVLIIQVVVITTIMLLLFTYVINGKPSQAHDISSRFMMKEVPSSSVCHVCDLLENNFVLKNSQSPLRSGFYSTGQTVLYVGTLPKKSENAHNQVLEIPYTMLAYITVWFITDDKVEKHHSGMRVAMNSRTIKDNSNVFPVPQTTSAVQTVIEIKTDGPLEFKTLLWSVDDWVSHQSKIKTLYGLFFGILLILIFYSIFHAVTLSESSYYYYVFYLICNALIIGTHSGLTKLFLWPNIDVIETPLIYLLIPTSAFCGLMFCMNFLNIKKHSPALYWPGIFIIFAIIFISLLNILNIHADKTMQVYFIFSVIALLYYTSVPLYFYIRGITQTSYLVLGFYSLTVTISYTTIKAFSLVGNEAVFHDLLATGVLMEMIFLSIALSQRISHMKRDKQLAEKKLHQAQSLFTQSLIENQEKDRAELSSYLHDSIGHDLLIMKQRIEKKAHSNTRDLLDNCDQLIENIRTLSSSMHPHVLKNLGLEAAINQLAENAFYRTYIDWATNIDVNDHKLSEKIQITVYRIMQEAISNILKHAKATEVFININQDKHQIYGEIKDDGDGLNLEKTDKKSSGLGIMRGRIQLLNGQLNIYSQQQQGFRLQFTIPL